MIAAIKKDDLLLINALSKRSYRNNQLSSSASVQEKNHFFEIKGKLAAIAEYVNEKYQHEYGPFDVAVTTGNPIAIGGMSFKRVWSGVFKGSHHKQYSAQISFVMNPDEACLEIGFYFGRAASHNLNREQINDLKQQLVQLRNTLSDSLRSNKILYERYSELFDYGFYAYLDKVRVSPDVWLEGIRDGIAEAQVIAKVHPNEFDLIEISTIDFYVSMIAVLMSALESETRQPRNIKPLSPQQRAKQAERLSLIGQKGELFVMNYERKRLKAMGIDNDSFPKHVALESMSFGFDILSLMDKTSEIYIEVKTTTRERTDEDSNRFFLSNNEYEVYKTNKRIFRVYRVYDIDVNPHVELINMEEASLNANGYIVTFKEYNS